MAKFRYQLKEAMDLKLYRDGIQRLKNLNMRNHLPQEEQTATNSDMSGILNVEIRKPLLRIQTSNDSLDSLRAKLRSHDRT